MTSAQDAMAVIERLLRDTTLRSIPHARAVDFDLGGERWSLDPKRETLVARGSSSSAALVLRTSPDVALRLFTGTDFALAHGEALSFAGDPAALQPIIDALAGGKSGLGVRLGAASPSPSTRKR